MADEPDLHEGTEGEWVTYLQQWLTHLGFYAGTVDGSFGPVTQEAVNTLQSQF
jgi:peptidoglycan hydrolase-like protein with peptidoglycan-binding domain